MKLKHPPHHAMRWVALASAELDDDTRIRSAHITYGTIASSQPIVEVEQHEDGSWTCNRIASLTWPDVCVLLAPGANPEQVARELEHLADVVREKGSILIEELEPHETEDDGVEALRTARAGSAWLRDGVMPSPTITRPSRRVIEIE